MTFETWEMRYERFDSQENWDKVLEKKRKDFSGKLNHCIDLILKGILFLIRLYEAFESSICF